MDAAKTLVDRLQMHTLRWLAKGPGSTWLIAGTLACAGFGAAALNAPAGATGQQDRGTVGTVTLPSSCWADPDGDGHIFCDGTVPISKLPASLGYCYADPDGDGHIFCDGTDR
jgi:hypothetical protein